MGDEATGRRDDGIDAPGLESWFAANMPGTVPPLHFERIAGGLSNLTYRVTDDAGASWALRRPPLGKRLGSAHDMVREHRVVAALSGTEVPVAPVAGLCEDEAVNGAPFYVMGFVEGPVLRGLAEADLFPDEGDRWAIGERVADTLAAIHAVDPDAVGLGELGRKQDYVARQLRRWQGQWEKSKTRELAAVDRVHESLAARIPEQGPATIVHGDYRLDNMILTASGEVAAVVDWELCTLGDPLADVGTLMAYWPDRGEDMLGLGQPANLAPGFPTRAELATRYAERSGRDLSDLDFFLALGYWKLAIILEGVYARYVAGSYGKVDDGVEYFARLVERLAEEAERVEAR
jgi:aminoglycoside phosphotransferase (APT) family kinase protein